MRSSRTLVVLSVLLAAGTISPVAADEALPPSLTESVQPLILVNQLRLPGIDLAAVQAEDAKREEEGLPPRFAVPQIVSITAFDRGTWETLPSGVGLWRMRFASPDALSLNFGFTRFHLPPGAALYVYTPDYQTILGPYTDRDNERHRQLWTPVVLGDEAVVELKIEPRFLPYLELELGAVNHGYTGFGYPSTQKSGSCNLDVVCGAADGYPEVDDWRDQIRSVAVISTGGSTFCTGFMVNNTAEDLTPYFMTADHCGISSGNAPSLVTYWNYENSWCRPPGSAQSGGPGDGSLAQSMTGSFFRAGYSPSDVTIVELDDTPPPAFNLHWAGWDNTAADPTSAVAIHHPNTDEKRISFENEPTSTTSYLGSSSPGDGTHIRVADWDIGTTEPGSSGSPLFDQNHRIVGQLHGGYAACGNDDPDWYGRVSVSWNGGGSSSTRLEDWLDPGNTGAPTVDGRDQCTPPTVDFSIAPNPADAGEPVSFTSSVSGGAPGYTYEWDFYDDGTVDSTQPNPTHTYTAYYNGNVTLKVTDSAACPKTASHAMLVNAASVAYTSTGTPAQLCGDGDTVIEPGEEWSVPVTVDNVGNVAAANAQAQVAVAGSPPTVGLTQGTLDFGTIAAGGQAFDSFSFLVDPLFSPCGAPIVFDIVSFTWTGGTNPGMSDVFTAATGGGSGTQAILSDDFEDPNTWGGLNYPGDDKWAVTTGPGAHTAGEWQRTNLAGQRPTGSTGFYALTDSDAAGTGSSTSTILTSPVSDMSAVLSGTVTLELDVYFNYYSSGGTEHAQIEVFDGASWQVVDRFDAGTGDVNQHQSYDVSAHALANPDFKVRFSYQDAQYDWWFSVDNVQVNAPLTPVCDNTVDCGSTETPLFADGFESGDTVMWSATVP